MGDHSVILPPISKYLLVPHACIVVSRASHAYELCDDVIWWIMWLYVEMCTWWCLSFGDCLYTWWFDLMMVIWWWKWSVKHIFLVWWFLWWWWFPCLYFWNDELYSLSWLGKSLYDLYDWCELDELYALCEVCALCKMSEVACMIILSKWWSWCSLMIKLNKEWGEKFLYWLKLISDELLMMIWLKNEYVWYAMIEIW